MALYIFDVTTGRLESWSPDDDCQCATSDQLAAKGLAAMRGLPSLDDTHVWDEAQRLVVTVAAPLPVREVAGWQFVLLFEPQEYAAIDASTDPGVRQFLRAAQMAPAIDLNGATTRRAFAYLVSKGLLTQERADAILASGI